MKALIYTQQFRASNGWGTSYYEDVDVDVHIHDPASGETENKFKQRITSAAQWTSGDSELSYGAASKKRVEFFSA
jgi:hypothetical protein